MIKVSKVKAVEGAVGTSAETIQEYRDSLSPGAAELSPCIDYWVAGNMLEPPEVGKCFVMNRTIRNGLTLDGIFYTTPVTEVFEGGFKTQNSVYSIEEYVE